MAASQQRGLSVVRAASIDLLADDLAQRLRSAPPADPFATVEIAVPGRGMERWLTQRLGHDLGATQDEAGVCAGVTMPFVGSVIQRTLSATLDDADTPVDDPWQPRSLVWPLLALLDDLPADDVYEPLHLHLSDGAQRADRRRLPLARRIAELFDRYALHRPHLVARWTDGEVVGPDGRPLPEGQAWQPRLWQQLTGLLGALPGGQPGVLDPAERVDRAMQRLRQGEVARPEVLPDPVTIFGVLGLPARHLDLLAALGHVVSVTVFAVAPCRFDDTATEPRNQLAAADGRAAFDAHVGFAGLVARTADATSPVRVTSIDPDGTDDTDTGDTDTGDTTDTTDAAMSVLAMLQADVRADRRRGTDGDVGPITLRADDRSVQVHACHGPVRQLEVLREVLLGLLEDDDSLEPRDIVVLTPDIEALAPLVAAAFGAPDDVPQPDVGTAADAPGGATGRTPPALRVRVADRNVRPGNAVADALARLLDLATSRVGASEVLDLLATPPVRARFGLSDADLAVLPQWLLGTGTTWGIDASHRRALIGLDDAAHTWSAGLDRLTLGAAMADDGDRLVGDTVPYDDVETDGVDLLGRLASATDTLFTALAQLRDPRPRDAWRDALLRAIGDLLDVGDRPDTDPTLIRQVAAVRTALDEVLPSQDAVPGVAGSVELTLEEIRWLLGDQLATDRGATAYGTGSITVSGLVPLRNLPHRVVCLVGLDDGALPRAAHEHGFDLLITDPQPGDPDPRGEDRQLFLDALLAARDHLVITYTGHDPRTNEARAPAVPVSELLDVLDTSLVTEGTDAAGRDRLITVHPLQPHSPRYFLTDGDREVPHAFDREHLAAARATTQPRTPRVGFAARPLPPDDATDVTTVALDDLVSCLQHPPRFTLQERLGLSLGDDDRRLQDRDPIELDAMQRWRAAQGLLDRWLADDPVANWRTRQLASGTVPAGGLGEVALDLVEADVRAVVASTEAVTAPPRVVTIDLDIPVDAAAVRLLGSVELRGDILMRARMSRLSAKHRIEAWVELLAVLAAGPDRPVTARLIARPGSDGDTAQVQDLDPMRLVEAFVADAADDPSDPSERSDSSDPHDSNGSPGDVPSLPELAREQLARLIAIHRRAHVMVLPMLPSTGRAYVLARHAGADHDTALAAARKAWEGGFTGFGDALDPYVVQAFGPDADLGTLLDDHRETIEDMLCLWTPVLIAEGRG